MVSFTSTAPQTQEPLQLLLFVDSRPPTALQIQAIRSALVGLDPQQNFNLQVLQVSEEPQLVEHFKLVATPALIKTHPRPRQVLAGSDLVAQLQYWWPRWELLVNTPTLPPLPASPPTLDLPVPLNFNATNPNPPSTSPSTSEVLRLYDEVFRLQQDKLDLEAKLRFKDRILAMLAHDLRNPLTAAALAVETLEMSTDNRCHPISPAMNAHLLRQARLQIREIDRMITDLLQTAQDSQQDLFIQPREVDLQLLVLSVVDSLSNRLATKSQTLQIDIPTDLPHICADPDRLRQVLTNLFDNALKYTPEGGQISLVALHRTRQKVQVSICDTGPGIPETERDLIFNDRFRLSRDQALEGYGIGLSVCKRIICAHYGQIWVDAGNPQGSHFHFTIPVYT